MKDTFQQAMGFADERYRHNEQSRARYQLAFFIAMGLNVVAMLAVVTLAQWQTLIPIAVHHYDNGVTTIEPMAQKEAPMNRAQIESDLVRYVTHREAYESSSYRAQFDLVNLLSSAEVASDYLRSQQANNPDSPVKLLGDNKTRQVHVYSVNFMDNVLNNDKDLHKNHQNLAEVVFATTDINKASGQSVTQSFSALIAWRYVTPPKSPDLRWKNFDGFQVTGYNRQQRNSTRENA